MFCTILFAVSNGSLQLRNTVYKSLDGLLEVFSLLFQIVNVNDWRQCVKCLWHLCVGARYGVRPQQLTPMWEGRRHWLRRKDCWLVIWVREWWWWRV